MVTQRPSKQLEWSFWLICNRSSLLPYLFFLFPQLSGQMTRFTSCFLSLCFLIPLTVTSWTRPVWAKATCATSMQPHHTAGDSMVVTCVCFAATAHTHTCIHNCHSLPITNRKPLESSWSGTLRVRRAISVKSCVEEWLINTELWNFCS